MKPIAITAAIFAALCTVGASTAAANEPVTAGSLQLGLGFRYGFDMEDSVVDPWGAGLGLNGGITLPNALYLGGQAEYFFGEEVSVLGEDFSANVWQIMGEAGYDLGLGPLLVVRPKAGLGLANYSAGDDSESNLAIAPGATAIFFLQIITITVDLRYDIVLADPNNASALLLTIGIGL